jgi:TldD protein
VKDFNKVNQHSRDQGHHTLGKSTAANQNRLTKRGSVEAANSGIESASASRACEWRLGICVVGSLDTAVLKKAVYGSLWHGEVGGAHAKNPHKARPSKTVEERCCLSPKRTSGIAMEDKIKTALTITKTSLSYNNQIKSCGVDYMDLMGISTFVNSEGTHIEQDKLYVWSRITASAQTNGVFTFSREEVGSTSGYELFDEQTPEELGKKVAERAIQQLTAKQPKGGKFPVVLGPNVVGVFVHEAFGILPKQTLHSQRLTCQSHGQKNRLQSRHLL